MGDTGSNISFRAVRLTGNGCTRPFQVKSVLQDMQYLYIDLFVITSMGITCQCHSSFLTLLFYSTHSPFDSSGRSSRDLWVISNTAVNALSTGIVSWHFEFCCGTYFKNTQALELQEKLEISLMMDSNNIGYTNTSDTGNYKLLLSLTFLLRV